MADSTSARKHIKWSQEAIIVRLHSHPVLETCQNLSTGNITAILDMVFIKILWDDAYFPESWHNHPLQLRYRLFWSSHRLWRTRLSPGTILSCFQDHPRTLPKQTRFLCDRIYKWASLQGHLTKKYYEQEREVVCSLSGSNKSMAKGITNS